MSVHVHSLGKTGSGTTSTFIPSRSTFYLVRQMLTPRYRAATVAAIVTLILAGVAEVLGIAAILPILFLATDASQAGGRVSNFVHNAFSLIGGQPGIETLLVIVVAGTACKSLIGLAGQQLLMRGRTQLTEDLRSDLIQALMKARWSYVVEQRTGAITNAISSEASRAGGIFAATINIIVSIMTAIPFAVMAFGVSWQITAGALFVSALIMVVLRTTLARTRRHSRELVEISRSLVARLVDSVTSLKPLKAMNLQGRIWNFLKSDIGKLTRAERQQSFAKNLNNLIQEPLVALFVCVGLYFAIKELSLSFAEIGFMLVLFQRLVVRFVSTQNQVQMMVTAEASYLHVIAEISAARAAAEREQAPALTVTPNQDVRLTRSLEFRRVTFSYSRRSVLKDFELILPARQMTVIAGSSGAGKTTLVDLIIGLQWPQSGAVLIDDVVLTEGNVGVWRKHIGYVPQDLQLLSGTVLTNLTLMDESIGRDEAQAALEMAGAWGFVRDLPQGLDTDIGERGVTISGGQRQRIAIARALIRKPDLLILDEPTAALDPETELAICAEISRIKRTVTVLAISHQPALANYADIIIRLEGGKAHFEKQVSGAETCS